MQHDVVESGRQHLTPHLEHVRRLAHGVLEVARDLGHRGDEQVAEAVSLEPAVLGEPVLEEAAHHRLVVGQRHQAVAQVAGREHAHVAAEPARAAAVVRHGHDGGEIAGLRLEAAEQRGQPVASADGDDARPARQAAGGADLPRRLGRRLLEEPDAARAEQQRKQTDGHAVDREEQRSPVPVVQPAHTQPGHELRRPEHADAEEHRVDQQHAACERQQDPPFEPQARGEPLERSTHQRALSPSPAGPCGPLEAQSALPCISLS